MRCNCSTRCAIIYTFKMVTAFDLDAGFPLFLVPFAVMAVVKLLVRAARVRHRSFEPHLSSLSI